MKNITTTMKNITTTMKKNNKPTTMDIIVRNTQDEPFVVLGRELSRRHAQAPAHQHRHNIQASSAQKGGEEV